MGYAEVLADVVGLLEQARFAAVAVPTPIVTATHCRPGSPLSESSRPAKPGPPTARRSWAETGRGSNQRFGRGSGHEDLRPMRQLYMGWPRSRALRLLIWADVLSSGRVRRPSPMVGAGASRFVGCGLGERVVGDARSD